VAARALADRAGVRRTSLAALPALGADAGRTTYFFDVRSPAEFAQGRLQLFRSAPGGQLVQETEQFAPVRGARFVLADSDGVRANMTASWLRQMNHEVHVVDGVREEDFNRDFNQREPWSAPLPDLPPVDEIGVATLASWLADDGGATVVLDFASGADYARGHVPGAWFVLRSSLGAALRQIPAGARRYVLTCGSGPLARFASADLRQLTGVPLFVLDGGTAAWSDGGRALESGPTRLASPLIDRYRRPYEGTDNQAAAMQAYLDWEFGLVAQLARDATHGFRVL
jgi:rhodanese-related sulfurtransferase